MCFFPQPGLPVGFLQYLKDIGQGSARGRFPRHPGTGSPKDLGTKILVPRSTESPRGGASRYAGGHGGLQAPRQGVWGAGSPPGIAGGPGGGSPAVKTILWTQIQELFVQKTILWLYFCAMPCHYFPVPIFCMPCRARIFRVKILPAGPCHKSAGPRVRAVPRRPCYTIIA